MGSVCPNADFSQFTLLPELMEHWELHQAEGAADDISVTFVDFLAEHYSSGVDHSHGGEEHSSIPLQQISAGIQFVVSIPEFDPGHIAAEHISCTYLTPQQLCSADYTRELERPPSAT